MICGALCNAFHFVHCRFPGYHPLALTVSPVTWLHDPEEYSLHTPSQPSSGLSSHHP